MAQTKALIARLLSLRVWLLAGAVRGSRGRRSAMAARHRRAARNGRIYRRGLCRIFRTRKPVSAVEGEFAARYWFSIGKTAKNLYDIPGSALVSRLSYDGLRGHSAEAFGRADHTSGLYVKGYLGGGILTKVISTTRISSRSSFPIRAR